MRRNFYETPEQLEAMQRKYVFFPWSPQGSAHAHHVVQAEGCWLTFQNGQRVLDFCSQIFNANIGHGHPKIKQAIRDAAELACVPNPSGIFEEKMLLGKNLARLTPSSQDKGLIKSFLCLGGAEANENAIKIAQMVTGRKKVVTRYRSYHGATLAMLGFGGDYRRIPFDGIVNGAIRIPDPYERGSGQKIDTLQLLEEILEIEGPETVACVLLEGITGSNGVFVPENDYWPRVREICTKHGIILIADEVLSGFGRTGKWFALDHFGVTPDMMTLAKGMTAGYAPLGAVVVNEAIAKRFEDETLWCGLTAYGHPLPCAIANTAIEVYESENLVENAAKRGEELKAGLASIAKNCSMVAETRSIGLLAALDLRKSASDESPYVPYRANKQDNAKAKALHQNLLNAGIQCFVRFGTVMIAPPLCITKEELSTGMGLLERTLVDLTKVS